MHHKDLNIQNRDEITLFGVPETPIYIIINEGHEKGGEQTGYDSVEVWLRFFQESSLTTKPMICNQNVLPLASTMMNIHTRRTPNRMRALKVSLLSSNGGSSSGRGKRGVCASRSSAGARGIGRACATLSAASGGWACIVWASHWLLLWGVRGGAGLAKRVVIKSFSNSARRW